MNSDGGSGHVVIVGSAHPDTVLSVPSIPVGGQTLLATGVALGLGGKGANQASAAARAGARVGFVGAVGSDEAGAQVISGLRQAGVDTRHVARADDMPTGGAYVMVEASGDNAIVVSAGANGALEVGAVERAVREVDAAAVIVVQCEIPVPAVEAAIRQARARSLRVVLNLAPYVALAADVLQSVTVLVVNETEAALLLADWGSSAAATASAVVSATGAPCIVTQGAAGSEYADPAGLTFGVPAVPAAQVVDTTGAGDVYVGTLAARLAAGHSVESAMTAASAAASVAVSFHGAQPRTSNGAPIVAPAIKPINTHS